jgi:hypothetical protein
MMIYPGIMVYPRARSDAQVMLQQWFFFETMWRRSTTQQVFPNLTYLPLFTRAAPVGGDVIRKWTWRNNPY